MINLAYKGQAIKPKACLHHLTSVLLLLQTPTVYSIAIASLTPLFAAQQWYFYHTALQIYGLVMGILIYKNMIEIRYIFMGARY